MVRSLERRVSALEETAGGGGGGGGCPECGWDGDWSKIEYVVDWANADGQIRPEEFCETCGSQLSYTVHATWDNAR